MKKVLSRLSLIIIAVLSAAGCFLRLFQLLRYTDNNTGLVTSNAGISYAVYAIVGVAVLASALYAYCQSDGKSLSAVSSSKSLYVCSILCAVSFFYDFVRQSLSVYSYFEENRYIEYNYIAFVILSAVSAVLSCFYMVMCAKRLSGNNFSFKSLGVFHFAPVLWAFSRLVTIMIRIVDFKENTESCCEFVFLISFICFFFSLICAVDRQDKRISRLLYFWGTMTFFSSFIISTSRLLVVLFGRQFLLYDASFSSITYLLCGVTALCAVLCALKEDKRIIQN